MSPRPCQSSTPTAHAHRSLTSVALMQPSISAPLHCHGQLNKLSIQSVRSQKNSSTIDIPHHATRRPRICRASKAQSVPTREEWTNRLCADTICQSPENLDAATLQKLVSFPTTHHLKSQDLHCSALYMTRLGVRRTIHDGAMVLISWFERGNRLV